MKQTPPSVLPSTIVSGATGFIGQAFLREGERRRRRITALARCRPAAADDRAVRWVESELDQVPDTTWLGADALVHLAATGVTQGADDWERCFEVNVRQSFALWQGAVAAGVRRFIICGSCFEYGRNGERYEFIPVTAPLEPVSAYAASKAAASQLALGLAATADLQLTLVRPFHVYGEGESPDRFWPQLCAAAKSGRDFPMTDGAQIRDFTPVEQVARDIWNLLEAPRPPAGLPVTLHLGTGEARSLAEFAASEWKRLGGTGKLRLGHLPRRPREVARYVPALQTPPQT